MIESTYSVSSFSGLVSSKRRLVWPLNSSARPKSRQIALAWPMWRYQFGSGGKRVCTRPLYLLLLRSSRTISRMKFDGRGSAGPETGLAAASVEGLAVITLILPVPVIKLETADAVIAPEQILTSGVHDEAATSDSMPKKP